MDKPVVIIIGAQGQVGKEVQSASKNFPDLQFRFLSRNELSISDADSIERYFRENSPAYCINCAAYTAVDKAETDREAAMQINADAVGVLALVCAKYGAKLIHLSTDYVFDGTANTPYKEDFSTNPVNYYGITKLDGEHLCRKNNANSIIVRTSWVYSAFGNNFVKTMLRLMKERTDLNVVQDQVGSPTYAADLSNQLLKIIDDSEKKIHSWQPGIYHYSNEGVISWYQFAVAIREIAGINSCTLHPIPSTSYPTPAKRPGYSVFDKSKIKSTFNASIPFWKDSLVKCITLIREG